MASNIVSYDRISKDFGYPGLIILMMTGYADQRERADGLNKIVIDVVTKPFSLMHIREQVRLALAA